MSIFSCLAELASLPPRSDLGSFWRERLHITVTLSLSLARSLSTLLESLGVASSSEESLKMTSLE